MKKEIVVPSAGESVKEADIAGWNKANGDYVRMDEVLLELETDKASMPLTAEASGTLTIIKEDGTVNVGDVIGYITVGDQKPADAPQSQAPAKEEKKEEKKPAQSPQAAASGYAAGHPSPAAARILAEKNISPADIHGSGRNGRITKDDAQKAEASQTAQPKPAAAEPAAAPVKPARPVLPGERVERRERMSRLRRTIAQRLVDAQHTAALLTTFNEVDMSAVMEIRKKYKDSFKEKHNVGLGFMSFFTKAVCVALREFPAVNAYVDGDEIIFHDYCDVGIAVATPKGLVVPVIRDAQARSFDDIERVIADFGKRGRDGKLSLEDMEGGTFTITNGGVFGSMLSTPIVNRPQSAILGMHNIVQRPVAVDGQVVIRPIMYLALTYDHRIIDGAEAVRFLVTIKEQIEDPTRLLIGI